MGNPIFTPENKKLFWATTRSVLELDSVKHKKNGKRSQSHWSTFERLLRVISFGLKITGFDKLGKKNALDIKKKELQICSKNLPESFDGFSILHLSDLHIDSLPELPEAILNSIGDETYDICVLTGDYRFDTEGAFRHLIEPLKKITNSINTRHGILAILGNHDTCNILNYEDELKTNFLINESISIKKDGDTLTFTGTDDPFKYFTQSAVDALEEPHEGYKIALIHTTELADAAAQNKYDLYLCGHTHAGQICLPGGIPLITHQYEGKNFYKGEWELNGMKGYTSPGCGVSGIPIRFFSRGEVTKIILKHKV